MLNYMKNSMKQRLTAMTNVIVFNVVWWLLKSAQTANNPIIARENVKFKIGPFTKRFAIKEKSTNFKEMIVF